jgi:hypothetical protein
MDVRFFMGRARNKIFLQRVDKRAFSVTEAGEPGDDQAFWLEQTPEVRIQAMETIRKILYGKIESAKGFSKFFEIVE